MKNSNSIKLIVWAVGLLIVSVIALLLFEVKTIRGNEAGVKETWNDGVIDQVLPSKTYFLFPGFSQEIYSYDMSAQVTELKNYRVQSAEGQDLIINAKLQWRRDQMKLVAQHKTVRLNIEDKIIIPIMMRVIKDESTAKKAIEQYSGDGLVTLQAAIQRQLSAQAGELVQKGVIVENFVIVHIDLDPKYIEEIKGKQIATQRTLRANEERLAADAEALVVKAKAQADAFKQVVESERDAKVMVVTAQAQNEKAILGAKAEKEKLILEADGNRLAQIAKAEGVVAMGKAEAEAQKLKLMSYAVQGSDSYTRIEISKNLATAFQNIKGYLPESLKISVLSGDFDKALDAATGNPIVPIKK